MSSKSYLAHPITTLRVGSEGTRHALELARRARRHDAARLDQRGLRRPPGAPPVRAVLGPREPGRPPQRLRRGQALRRGPHDGLPPPVRHRRADRCGSSTPTGPAWPSTTGGSCPTSSARRSQGKPITVFGDGSQTRSFCYVDDEIRGLPGPARPRRHRARSTSATTASSPSSSSPRWSSRSPARRRRSSSSPCPRTTPPSAGPTSPWPAPRWDWAPTIELREGLERTVPYFRRVLESEPDRQAQLARSSASSRWAGTSRSCGAGPPRRRPRP